MSKQSKLTAFLRLNHDQDTKPTVKDHNQEKDDFGSTHKRIKNFQTAWLGQFDWLRWDSKQHLMFCITCEKFNRSSGSAFVEGSSNFQRSALLRHQKSDDQVIACQSRKQKTYMDTARQCVTRQYLPILEAQLRTALWMASENVANRKFLRMIDLQIANAPAFNPQSSCPTANAAGSRKGVYTYNMAASDMQKCLGDVLTEMALVRIRNSPYIGIMTDESLDIATNKKLIMFCKIVHNGEMRIEFCANIDIVNGTADTVYNCIIEWLESVDIKKVSGFGSGVGVRLQRNNPKIVHIWCAAHRVSSTGQLLGCKESPLLTKC